MNRWRVRSVSAWIEIHFYFVLLPGSSVKCLLFALAGMSLFASVAVADDVPTGLRYPIGVAVSAQSDVYVADRKLPGVWKITAGKPTVYFQASKKFRTPLNAIRCIAVDQAGRVIAGDSATRDVYRVDDQGKVTSLAGGQIGIPTAIAIGRDGEIFVAGLDRQQIYSLPSDGTKQPKVIAKVPAPRGLAVIPDGGLLVLSSTNPQGQILEVSLDGKVSVKGATSFGMPHKIVRMDDGTLFVTDNYQRCVWKVPSGGMPEKWVTGAPLDRPVGLCRMGDQLLVTDPHLKTVFTVGVASGKVSVFSGGLAQEN